MDVTDRELYTRMAALDEAGLRAILDASRDEYTPQARLAAEAELSKRRSAPAEGTEGNRRFVSHDIDAWHVEPLPAKPVTESERAALKSQSREGLAGPSALAAIIIAVSAGAATREPMVGVLAGLIVAAFIYHRILSARCQIKLQELEESRALAARKEAEELALRLMKTLNDSEAVFSDVERGAQAATRQLLHARHEFSATAYAPFWDAVEGCASELGSVRRNLAMLATHATDYATVLKGRRHTFPPLRRVVPVSNELKVIQIDLKAVVREAQRDFQFAVIWEHRKTRAAMVDGFRTLGDAVEGISGAIYSTSNMLQATLASGFADVVSGYQRVGERLTSSLDRIEGHAAESAAAGRDIRDVISRYRLLE